MHLNKDDGHEPLDDELPLRRVEVLVHADGEQVLVLGSHWLYECILFASL